MKDKSACWLIVNPASGDGFEQEADRVAALLNDRAWFVSRRITFPDTMLPTREDLDAEGVELAVVFAGDGTANAVLHHLRGWRGRVLVLPGGTMNLLATRLHGTAQTDQILDVVAANGASARSIATVRHEAGAAFAELLVGPGTCWHQVRETMREGPITDVATEAIEAMRTTTDAPGVQVKDTPRARAAGYPLVAIVPGEFGLQIDGYYAEQPLEFAAQAWQTVRRRFREGPHDRIGLADRVAIASADGSPVPCLSDGEPMQIPSGYEFTAGRSEVKLLATGHA